MFDESADQVLCERQTWIDEAEAMRVRASEARQKSSMMTDPWQQLDAKRYLFEAQDLETDADSLVLRASNLSGQVEMWREMHQKSQPHENHDVRTSGIAKSKTIAKSKALSKHQKQPKTGIIHEMIQELVGRAAPPIVQNSTLCPACSQELVLSTVKALLICPDCGISQPYLDATPACVAYDEGGRREMYSSASYTYRRCNHLYERMSQLQAQSAAVVTDTVLKRVCEILARDNVSPCDITASRVKDALKEMRARKVYEYVVLVTRILQGRPPITFTRDTLEKLRRMFGAVQRPFENHCPEGRANFLSYSYVLYKFLELLGAYDLLPYVILLKGRTKLLKQDSMWEKICSDPSLGWEYVPSLCNGM
jgi:hypothetical protein